MELTITKVLVDKVRMYQNRPQWPVITVQYGERQWVTLDCGFEPTVGMTLDCTMTEKPNPKGGFYYNARYQGPPPQQQAPAPQPSPTPQPAPQPPANSQPASLPAHSGKIEPRDWREMALWAAGVAEECGLEMDARGAFINTTMIAFSNGKLELPAQPSTEREPGQDDDLPDFLK